MKIIIIGAGQVGSTLTEKLVTEKNDLTVIDTDRRLLGILNDKYDLRTVCGLGTHPDILASAGAADAEMLVAVSESDEVNILACQIADTLFHVPNKIARIRSREYIERSTELFGAGGLSVDKVISPEMLVTSQIAELVFHPGTSQVMEFSNGELAIVMVKACYGGFIVGNTISAVKSTELDGKINIVAIIRNGKAIRLSPGTVIEGGDEVYFITQASYIGQCVAGLERIETPYRRILIIGGGNIGAGLARKLQTMSQVKLVEGNRERAERLSEELEKTMVFEADPTDRDFLDDEGIAKTDLVIAVTSSDESNIMASSLAKKLGAKKSIALVQREIFLDLIDETNIDIAVSPQQVTISALLSNIRHADVKNVYSLRSGSSEAMEIVAHGSKESSNVIGKKVKELDLPQGVSVSAIIRDGASFIIADEMTVKDGDHIIIFLTDRTRVREIERLFQPSPFF